MWWGAEGMWERKGAKHKVMTGGKKKEMVALVGWALRKCGFVAEFPSYLCELRQLLTLSVCVLERKEYSLKI